MPFSRFTLKDPSGTPRLVSAFSLAEKNTLTAMTAYVQFPVGIIIEFWARIGIVLNDNPNLIVVTLAQGYITTVGHVSWTGSLKLDPTMQLAISAVGDGLIPIQVSFVTEVT